MNYLQKMKGDGQSPPAVGLVEVLWSWLGSFVGIGAVSLIHFKILNQTDLMMIIGSFGASAVLIYGAIRSPLAQPRNLIGGHILSAIIGVQLFNYLEGNRGWRQQLRFQPLLLSCTLPKPCILRVEQRH